MDRHQILQSINEEISRLERVKELLGSANGHAFINAGDGRGASGLSQKRILSEDARNRISQAQKRRWAKQRKEGAAVKKA